MTNTTKKPIRKRIDFNKNFNLNLFKSGDVYMNLHNIKSVKMGKWEKLTDDANVRTIEIKTTDKQRLQLSLFRDTQEVTKCIK